MFGFFVVMDGISVLVILVLFGVNKFVYRIIKVLDVEFRFKGISFM